MNLCKWRHLVVKFASSAIGAMLLPNLVQVTESISGSVVPLAMFLLSLCEFSLSIITRRFGSDVRSSLTHLR